jgi:Mn2+/Fe2+ NRAMP family transporter
LITACVVIGPGSILTSSQVGADYGYSMLWVVVVAVFFMIIFMRLSSRLGVVTQSSPADLLTQQIGRPAAAFVGLAVGLTTASFQFGNNLGVHAAFRVYFPFEYTIVVFNLLSLLFLFGFRNLYRALERLMALLVAMMLLAFAANLMLARPDPRKVLSGFVPHLANVDLSLLGLVGTTFVISAAYYQAYLVQQKGWRAQDLPSGLIDVYVGGLVMACITLMLITTAATALRGQQLQNVQQIAISLRPLFQEAGTALFCVGLFSAAYSSCLVNSMIGGFVLADGLGLGSRPEDIWTRICSAAILLIGMVVALLVIKLNVNPLPAIVMAQAITVIVSPFMAAALLWLTNRADVMGNHRNGIAANLFATVGLLLLLAMAWYTATAKIWPVVTRWAAA